VAAELVAKGYIVSPTSRNAMGADLLVTDEACERSFSVQVKTNAKRATFWLVGPRAEDMKSPSHVRMACIRGTAAPGRCGPSSSRGRRAMRAYDPDRSPRKPDWLALDDQERMHLVEAYHRAHRIRMPNARLHAVLHTIVENQIALEKPTVVEALVRLLDEGLDRHDAIHAIASVLAGTIHGALADRSGGGDPGVTYATRLRSLSASTWRAGVGDHGR